MDIRATIAALAFASVGGCASIPADAPAFRRAEPAPAGLENVYIYRAGGYPTLRSPIVKIDAKEIVSPPEGSYTVVSLAPGHHNVSVEWSWDTIWPNFDFPIEVKRGESYYLKLSGTYDRVAGPQYAAGTIARHVEAADAEAEMAACCRYIRPRSAS